ncbi:MAG: hypothetical protein ABSB42_01995 [Tepidisphaeraceae bacterium]
MNAEAAPTGQSYRLFLLPGKADDSRPSPPLLTMQASPLRFRQCRSHHTSSGAGLCAADPP